MGVQTLLTDDEFLNLPESECKQELLDGELIELPPAKLFHSDISAVFYELLRTVLPGKRVKMEAGYRLRSRRWFIPDVSVTWPDQRVENDYLQRAPMLAIEIISRGNTAESVELKVSAYLEDGAAEVWAVYPKSGLMMVYRKDATLRIPAGQSYHCDLFNLTITPELRVPPAR